MLASIDKVCLMPLLVSLSLDQAHQSSFAADSFVPVHSGYMASYLRTAVNLYYLIHAQVAVHWLKINQTNQRGRVRIVLEPGQPDTETPAAPLAIPNTIQLSRSPLLLPRNKNVPWN
jgi:hypothetical protein